MEVIILNTIILIGFFIELIIILVLAVKLNAKVSHPFDGRILIDIDDQGLASTIYPDPNMDTIIRKGEGYFKVIPSENLADYLQYRDKKTGSEQ